MARRGGNSNLSKHFQQGFANRMGQRAANRVPMHPTPMEVGRRRAVATSPALAMAQRRRMAMAAPTRVPVAPAVGLRRPLVAAPVRRVGFVRPPFGGLPQRRGY